MGSWVLENESKGLARLRTLPTFSPTTTAPEGLSGTPAMAHDECPAGQGNTGVSPRALPVAATALTSIAPGNPEEAEQSKGTCTPADPEGENSPSRTSGHSNAMTPENMRKMANEKRKQLFEDREFESPSDSNLLPLTIDDSFPLVDTPLHAVSWKGRVPSNVGEDKNGDGLRSC